MSTTRKLIMEFLDAGDKSFKLNINDIKDSLTLSEVTMIAEAVIADNVLYSEGGDLKTFKDADIVTTIIEKLE